MISSLLHRWKFFVPILIMLVVAQIAIGGQKADAVVCTVQNNNPTNIFPRANLGTQEDNGCADADSWIWMSDYYVGSPLQTPVAYVRVFFNWNDVASLPDPIDQINLYSPDASRVRCGFSMVATYEPTGAAINVSKPGSTCAWNTFFGFVPGSFSVNKADLKVDPNNRYGTNMRYVDIKMELTTTDTNAPFKVWAIRPGSTAKISFREQDLVDAEKPGNYNTAASNTTFALWTNDLPDTWYTPDQEKVTYTLNFAPDCTISPTTTKNIFFKWYDADGPTSGTQPYEIVMYIVDDTTGAHLTPPGGLKSNSYDFGGDNTYREYGPVEIKGGHRYRWIWSNIARNNGIQIVMPFSEINSDPVATCPPQPVPGCTDPSAINFNPSATVNDGSCIYNAAPSGTLTASCTGTTVSITMTTSDADGGNVTATITSITGGPPGVALPSPSAKTVSAGSNADFTTTGIQNGLTYTVNGNVTDPGGASSGNKTFDFKCDLPPPTISCSSISIDNGSIVAGTGSFTVSVTVARNQDALSPDIATISVSGNVASSPNVPLSGSSGVFARGSGTRTITLAPANITLNSAGIYDVSATISATWSGGAVGATSPGSLVCPVSNVRNSFLPYFKVDGEDVKVGGDFFNSATNSCATTARGSIFAYSSDGGASPTDFRGASTQFAAFARNSIEGFYTKDASANGTNGAVLSFANSVNTSSTTSDFGGRLGGTSLCIDDYFTSAQKPGLVTVAGPRVETTGSLVAIANPDSDQVMVNGDLTISGGLGSGVRLAVFVNGDVYINGNISAPAGNYGNASSIPFLGLFVRGNIYISSAVTQIDGFIVAQPSINTATNTFNPTSGVIYTCATGLRAPLLETSAPNSEIWANADCRTRQLTFNGYVVARRLKLLRALGHLDTAPYNATPAEVFNATPELFLVDELPINSITGRYESAASLPPIL